MSKSHRKAPQAPDGDISHIIILCLFGVVFFPERAGPRPLQRVVRESQASLWPILKHSERAKRTYPTALDIISHATMPNEPNLAKQLNQRKVKRQS